MKKKHRRWLKLYEGYRDSETSWWRAIETTITAPMVGFASTSVSDYFNGWNLPIYENDEDRENEIDRVGYADWDFVCEQIWAISRGLAEIPAAPEGKEE